MPTPEDFARLRQNMGIPEPETDAPAAAEPQAGWVLVPVKPTEAMLLAYEGAVKAAVWAKAKDPMLSRSEAKHARAERMSEPEKATARWTAMIRAAQQSSECVDNRPWTLNADGSFARPTPATPAPASRIISEEEAKLAHPEADRRRSLPVYRLLQEADQLLHEAMEGGPHQEAAAALHQRLHDAAYTFVTSTNIPDDPSMPLKAWVDFDATYNDRLAKGRAPASAPAVGGEGVEEDAENLRLLDFILDFIAKRIGIPHDEELTREHVEAYLAIRPPPPRADAAADDLAVLREAVDGAFITVESKGHPEPDGRVASLVFQFLGQAALDRADKLHDVIAALASTQRKED